MEEDALNVVDGFPFISAGVLISLAVKSAVILTSPVITPPVILNLEAVMLPSGVKWNPLELISMLLPEPLINCVFSVPTKNVFAFTSNILGLLLNLNELLFCPPCNSKPTPV